MKIYFVSGFLGSGKTSWIKDFLSKQDNKKSFLVLENDFGDINFDEIILGSDNIQIESLSSGCICCNISRDFIKTLKEIENRINPEIVIIEPSGVAMLSELKEKVNDYEVHSITILDGSSWKSNLDNYGEYYEDQIKSADFILINRSDISSIKDLEMEFPTCKFYLEDDFPKTVLSVESGIKIPNDKSCLATNEHEHDDKKHNCNCNHNHEHEHEHDYEYGHEREYVHEYEHGHKHEHKHEYEHGHKHEHEHEHEHEHDFKSVTITAPILSLNTWKQIFNENNEALVNGGWCRSKGIIEIESELYTLQWSGQNAIFEKYEPSVKYNHYADNNSNFEEINKIVWIGKTPDFEVLNAIFHNKNKKNILMRNLDAIFREEI